MIRTVIIPPAEEPLSLLAAKNFLQIGHDAEDDLIVELLAGGRAHVENSLDLALVNQTIETSISSSAVGLEGFVLRPGPISALISIIHETDDGGSTDVTGLFSLEGELLRLRAGESLSRFSHPGILKIQFQAGYGTASDVPDDLLLALRLLLGQSYQHRSGAFETNAIVTITDLLSPYREARL